MIYENVKAIAERKGMTIAELERKAILANGAIGKWRTSSPNVDSLRRVAEILEVSVDKLLSKA